MSITILSDRGNTYGPPYTHRPFSFSQIKRNQKGKEIGNHPRLSNVINNNMRVIPTVLLEKSETFIFYKEAKSKRAK